MNLREYKKEDANTILSWIESERELRLWSANRYGAYPIKADDINSNYEESKKVSNFYPLTLEDDGKVIGHLILRNPGEDKSVVRLGFIIVDHSIRGKGYGKKLINEGISYAKENLNAKEINLGVFTNNESAVACYKSVGFEVVDVEKAIYEFEGEAWDCAEMILK